jgi:hypothetical protein
MHRTMKRCRAFCSTIPSDSVATSRKENCEEDYEAAAVDEGRRPNPQVARTREDKDNGNRARAEAQRSSDLPKGIDFSLPESFEGMSGGAVWRFYVTKNKDGTLNPVDRRLIAVPFFQSPPSGGRREITCQGPMGIYGSLIDAVTKRWPHEASKT